MNCIFCAIAKKEAPAAVVYEDEQCLAFLSIQPITPGHVLVIPKAHASGLGDIPPQTCGHMMRVGQRMAAALRESGLSLEEQPCEGINLLLCDGAVAGQTEVTRTCMCWPALSVTVSTWVMRTCRSPRHRCWASAPSRSAEPWPRYHRTDCTSLWFNGTPATSG